QPWPADRAGTLLRLGKLTYDGTADVVWLSDGLEAGDAAGFAEALAKRGTLQVWTDGADQAAHLMAPAATDDKDLTATVRRATPGLEEQLWVRAVGDDGRLLARNSLTFAAGASSGLARLPMPSELRNQASLLQIEGEASAGAALLLDE